MGCPAEEGMGGRLQKKGEREVGGPAEEEKEGEGGEISFSLFILTEIKN